MKTTNEIIAYLEGRQAELEKRDPKPKDLYVIAELLAYIKSGGEENHTLTSPAPSTTPYIMTPPTYCYYERSQPCFYGGNCLACTKYKSSTLTTATNTGNNESNRD
jgi:hypothetical protein